MLGRYRDQLLYGFTPQREGDPDKPDDDAFDDVRKHALREDLRREDWQTAINEGPQATRDLGG
jgi:hypothetical protein